MKRYEIIEKILLGGKGSGHHGHTGGAGGPGNPGGSSSKGGGAAAFLTEDDLKPLIKHRKNSKAYKVMVRTIVEAKIPIEHFEDLLSISDKPLGSDVGDVSLSGGTFVIDDVHEIRGIHALSTDNSGDRVYLSPDSITWETTSFKAGYGGVSSVLLHELGHHYHLRVLGGGDTSLNNKLEKVRQDLIKGDAKDPKYTMNLGLAPAGNYYNINELFADLYKEALPGTRSDKIMSYASGFGLDMEEVMGL